MVSCQGKICWSSHTRSSSGDWFVVRPAVTSTPLYYLRVVERFIPVPRFLPDDECRRRIEASTVSSNFTPKHYIDSSSATHTLALDTNGKWDFFFLLTSNFFRLVKWKMMSILQSPNADTVTLLSRISKGFWWPFQSACNFWKFKRINLSNSQIIFPIWIHLFLVRTYSMQRMNEFGLSSGSWLLGWATLHSLPESTVFSTPFSPSADKIRSRVWGLPLAFSVRLWNFWQIRWFLGLMQFFAELVQLLPHV